MSLVVSIREKKDEKKKERALPPPPRPPLRNVCAQGRCPWC